MKALAKGLTAAGLLIAGLSVISAYQDKDLLAVVLLLSYMGLALFVIGFLLGFERAHRK
jgi:hypothetical protein